MPFDYGRRGYEEACGWRGTGDKEKVEKENLI